MPLPFILGAAAVLGAARTIDALDDMSTAKRINREAQGIADRAKKNLDVSQQSCKAIRENLLKNGQYIKESSIKDFTYHFLKIHNYPFENINQREELKNFAVTNDKFVSTEIKTFGLSDFAMVGAASYLLGFLNPATLVFSGFFVLGDKADKALSDAKSNRRLAENYEEKCKNVCSFLDRVSTCCNQVNNTLDNLNNKFIPTVAELRNIISNYGTDFKYYSPQIRQKVKRSFDLSDAIRQILNTPILTEDGKKINSKIQRLIEKYS